MSTCDFSGSYYNPEPWKNTPCGVEDAVHEGCPVHLVTGAAPDVTDVTTSIGGTLTANTATIVGSDLRSFTIPDQFSCDCSSIGIAVDFQRLAIDVPAAVAGDTVRVWGTGYDSQITITAAAPCPEPTWPTDYSVSLACDRCPGQDDASGGGREGESDDGDLSGCNAGGESSFALVAVLMLVGMMRLYAQHDRIRAGNGNARAGTRDGRHP